MRGRRGFTMIETLVVMAIVAILAAILVPVLGASRARAKLTACQASLYQHSRAEEMPDWHVDTSHCPYPQAGDDGRYIEVGWNYNPEKPPDGRTVRTYCVEHLKRGESTRFAVPLQGNIPVLTFDHSAPIVDAKSVTRWRRVGGGNWIQIPETGELPVWPQIWHFAHDDFPPPDW
jgi:prepilin-type N-terminal cleavage/methylation domain-containing protein